MSAELFCSIHGPYDAKYGTCPYCSGAYKRSQSTKGLEDNTLDPINGGQQRSLIAPEKAATRMEISVPTPKHFLDDDVSSSEIEEPAGNLTQLDSTPIGLQGILWVKEGSQRGRVYKVVDGTIIGRKSGNLLVNDPKVSNPHAKITVEDEQFILWDFGSKNGCYVNGERIRAATPLKENDLIRIGDTIFVLKVLQLK